MKYLNKDKKEVSINESYKYIQFLCENCNKEIIIYKYNYTENLCKSCKIKKTNLNRYGVSNVFQSKKIKEKIKNICIKKYGFEYANSNEEIKNKKKNTCLNKFGEVTNLKYNGGVKNIFKKKYNVENPSQLESVKNKIRNNIYNRTEEEKFLIKLKSKNTQVLNHGCWAFNTEQSKRNQLLYNYNKTINSLKNEFEPQFSFNEYFGGLMKYKWKCKICGNIFFDICSMSKHPRCLKCNPFLLNTSFLEKEVADYIKSLNFKIITNTYSIISPQEIDIYVPSKNLAIEFNGTYWHSNFYKEKWYHQLKVDKCNQQNIRLLHIYEWEWINDRQLCIEKINFYLKNLDKRILPRKPVARFTKNNKETNYSDYDTLVWD